MAPLVVPGGVRLGLIWQLDGADYAVNVLHGQIPAGVVVSASVSSWASAVAAAWDTAQLGHTTEGLANNVRLDRLTARDLREANLAEYQSPVAKTGTSAQSILPAGVCIVVTHRTAKAGRSFRGRSYVPGYTEGASTGSGVAQTYVRTRQETFWQAVRENLAASVNPCVLSILSTRALNADRPIPLLTPVTASVVRDLRWDYQRRRAEPGI